MNSLLMRKWWQCCLVIMGLGFIGLLAFVVVVIWWLYFPLNIIKDESMAKAFGLRRLTEECQRMKVPISEYKLVYFFKHPDDPKVFGTREEDYTLTYEHYSHAPCMKITVYLDKDKEWLIVTPSMAYYGKRHPLGDMRFCYDYLNKKGSLLSSGVFVDGVTGKKIFNHADEAEKLEAGIID
jgi:hypothetical protein